LNSLTAVINKNKSNAVGNITKRLRGAWRGSTKRKFKLSDVKQQKRVCLPHNRQCRHRPAAHDRSKKMVAFSPPTHCAMKRDEQNMAGNTIAVRFAQLVCSQ